VHKSFRSDKMTERIKLTAKVCTRRKKVWRRWTNWSENL